MLPHLPYSAEPKTYYYFRPYNYQHIAQHQDIAEQQWAAPRHLPYTNQMFEEIYEQIELGDKERERLEAEMKERLNPPEDNLPTPVEPPAEPPVDGGEEAPSLE